MQSFFTVLENVIQSQNLIDRLNCQNKILNHINNKMNDDQNQMEEKAEKLEKMYKKNLQEEMKINERNVRLFRQKLV